MLKLIFFDAAGTLFRLTKTVGQHYALVGARQGLRLDANELDRAFAAVWKEMPLRAATGRPRQDDDKGWWRELVDRMLDRLKIANDPLTRDAFFEAAYSHFAEAGVWELYAEVVPALDALAPHYRLSVISNFDGRLRVILKQLTISKYFESVFISSELGADKPDPAIYRRALEVSNILPNEALHVGDDPDRDWAAAAAAGLQVFELNRPEKTLRQLVAWLRPGTNQ